MQIICLENTAFYNLIETVVARVKEQKPPREDKWISADEAMHLLRIKSRTTLQKLRDDG